ncbi:MAG: hypothetical protein ACREK5_04155 [Gemmatimonadota bacterium]
MTRPVLPRFLIAALLIGGILTPTVVDAQVRSADPGPPGRPTRLPPRPTPTGSPSADPAAAGNAVQTGLPGLAPDLQISMSPISKNAVPTQFTIKNGGYGTAEEPTLLSVEVRLRPLPTEQTCTGDPEACALASPLLSGIAYLQLVNVCPAPMKSFTAEITALDPGQSQKVSHSSGPVSRRTVHMGSKQLKNSYIKEVTLVCVFEIKAVADATKEASESNEQNNESYHYVEREIAWQ